MPDKVIPKSTAVLSNALLDPALIAGAYREISCPYIGTSGVSSWIFGENGLTLPFLPPKTLESLGRVFNQLATSPKNLAAIEFLDEWFSEPDNLGEDFWQEFDEELKANRFNIP